MTVFTDVIEDIRKMAAYVCFTNQQFEIDELVNEAWIRGRSIKTTDAQLIKFAAGHDIKDYLRECLGRKQSKSRPKHFTNFIYNREENNIFDEVIFDKNLEEVDNREFIDKLLINHDKKRRKTLVMYYCKGMSYSEIAKELGVCKGSAYKLVTHGIKQCQDKLAEMRFEDG